MSRRAQPARAWSGSATWVSRHARFSFAFRSLTGTSRPLAAHCRFDRVQDGNVRSLLAPDCISRFFRVTATPASFCVVPSNSAAAADAVARLPHRLLHSNDCCFHIATTQKTIPLDKVQDVQLNTNCCLSCFHLKSVDVQTAGQGSAMAEVTAAFCKNPEQAREAIRLAVKRAKEAGPAGAALMAAPGQQAMSAAAGAAAGGAGGGLRVRFAGRLSQHVW